MCFQKRGEKNQMELLPTNPDRKSTRLNSSHVKISYVVFCLKKSIAASAAETPAAVLVTFAKDVELLGDALAAAETGWIQLHGYQSPGLVRRLKARAPDVKVLKVLHVKGGECLEGSRVGAYEKAGADAFLLDVVADYVRVSSTAPTPTLFPYTTLFR